MAEPVKVIGFTDDELEPGLLGNPIPEHEDTEDYRVHEVRLAAQGYKTSAYVLLEFEDGRWEWRHTEFAEALDKVTPTLLYTDFTKWPVKSPHA